MSTARVSGVTIDCFRLLASSPVPKMMGNPHIYHVWAGSSPTRKMDAFQNIREIDVCLKNIRAACHANGRIFKVAPVHRVGIAVGMGGHSGHSYLEENL